MKIAFYYPWIYLKGGAERTILALLQKSRHDIKLFTSHFDADGTFPEFRDYQINLLKKVQVKRSFFEVLKAAFTVSCEKIPPEQFDAMLVLSEGVGDFILVRNRMPTVCLCLSPLRPVFDSSYREHYLKDKNIRTRFLLSLFSTAFRFVDRRLWKYYRRVLCVSNEVKERVLRGGLRKSNDELSVLYIGIPFDTIIPSWVYEKYFLIVSRIMWTKNVELGIDAFKRFSGIAGFENFRLIIAGTVDEKSKGYFSSLQSSAQGYNIEFVVSPDDATLNSLYMSCYTTIFTPFNEDWGLTVLESMSFGKPVIAVNSGGPRESLTHGKTGFLCEPTADCFAERMAFLAADSDLVLEMGKAAREKVAEFSCNAFVDKLDNILEEVARDGR